MKSAKDQHDKQFVIQGVELYPQTLAALSEFHRLVEDMWRNSILAARSEFENAMGVNLNDIKINSYADPEKISKYKKWVALGVQMRSDDWLQTYYLDWNNEPEEKVPFSAVASIRVKDPQVASRLYAALSENVRPRTKSLLFHSEKEDYVYIWRPISRDGMGSIGEILREVTREWIRRWHEVGGLKMFLAKKQLRR